MKEHIYEIAPKTKPLIRNNWAADRVVFRIGGFTVSEIYTQISSIFIFPHITILVKTTTTYYVYVAKHRR